MADIYDNIEVKFTEGLNRIISENGVKRLDFCVGYFNLRGWNIVKDQIDEIPGDIVIEKDESGRDVEKFRVCRLLIGMHRTDAELLKSLYSKRSALTDGEYIRRSLLKIAQGFRQQLLIGAPTAADEATLRHLSTQMKEGKVCVKLYMKYPLHAKLYIAHLPDRYTKNLVLMGSSNLTYSGLTSNGEMNADFTDSDHIKKMSKWFDDRWNDRQCIDITKQLIQIIDESWAGEKVIPPYHIYLKTVYHLSRDARNGVTEFELSPEFRDELLPFQRIAVQIAAKRLNSDHRNGMMIGDVVGLGKTITACAIAKIFEDAFSASTLVICPANLQDMWRKYIVKYDLKAEVRSMAKTIDLGTMRRYKLIIVDESHNLRNSEGKRYQGIRELIQKQDAKVLLLTATPYNKDFSDLASQLRLFLEDDADLGIRPENFIQSIGGDHQFAYKYSDIDIRSIRAFEKSDNGDDWNELMKLFLLRRTRSFIKKHYAEPDAEGRLCLRMPDGTLQPFPDRVPESRKFGTNPGDQFNRLYSDEMIEMMESLALPRYGLSQYFDESKAADISKAEKIVRDNLSKAGKRMMGFAKSTFFKRIDSSGYAFLLTLCRHILRNAVYYYAIEHNYDLPISDTNTIYDAFSDGAGGAGIPKNEEKLAYQKDGLLHISTDWDKYLEAAADHYETLKIKDNCSWISPKYFKRTLKQKLKSDCNTLMKMIELCGPWDPSSDPKVKELKNLVTDTHKDDKLLIFTQFADTANYLYTQLKELNIPQIEVVTGASANQTEIVERFSPISNHASVTKEQQIRVLIATDVLSEGQNLQDSHIIVNYDLPWAIIRLIQRAGRVDRIGQRAPKIFCYSFFPAEGVEKIISLRKRLNDRINENAKVVGSDEYFFEGNEQNLRDMYNEKSGILDDDDDDDVDLSSQAFEIWKNATDADPELKKIIPALPNSVYSTKLTDTPTNRGVVTYARTANDFDVLTWVDDDGEIISQSQKKILKAMVCEALTPAEDPIENHHELVETAIDSIQENKRSVGGVLGSRFSTRARVHHLLVDYLDAESQNNLFCDVDRQDAIKLAIEEIYGYPLLSATKTALGSMLNSHRSDADIVDFVLEMRKEGTLCNVPKEIDDNREPAIICSMGLKYL